MTVRIELTSRLAEIAGFASDSLDVSSIRTLRDALCAVEQRLAGCGPSLLNQGRLHPSVLVVLNESACTRADEGIPLRGGETIRLMLPVAGG
jgi:molybdopterin converting factor small subunit